MASGGPYLVLPTRKGSLGNLTPAQVNSVLNDEEKWASISIFDATELVSPLSNGRMRLTEFCGLQDYKVILTSHNSFCGLRASSVSASSSGKVTVSANHEKGKLTLSPQRFLEIANYVQPDCVVCPFEASPLYEASERKRKISAIRSGKWAEEVGVALKRTDGDGPLNGVFYSDSIVRSPSGTEKNFVFISSLPGNENLQEFEENLTEISQHFSMGSTSSSDGCAENATFMISANSFPHFLLALKHGVTFIESSLPWSLAEKGVALVLPDKWCEDSEGEADSLKSGHSVSYPDIFSFLQDLNDHKYQLDATPLHAACKCYTCTRHTKAYLHHLLTVQEMNSGILLSIHNLSVLVEMTRKFRQFSNGGRELLYERLISFF